VSLLVVPVAWGQEVTPSVTVSDQAIEDGTVTVDSVVSDGAGWIVIHAQQEGAPGPVIGQAAVSDGENTDVVVEIDVSQATETLYAMLHADTGEEGVYEFPDADPPVEVEGEIVLQAFTVTGGLRPGVTVMEQAIEDSTVVVPEVISEGQGWMVIHADEDGAPGPVIGQAAVSDGVNTDVSVEIDVDAATETLWAMLHTDTGEVGTYEFPDADPPVQVEGNVVVEPFTVTGGLPAAEEEVEEEEAVTPSVTVSDQAIEDGTVTVDSVVSDGQGWMVIHADEDGAPGPVIGQAAVSDGENTNVVVNIDTDAATETLWAMLHEDTGEMGTYEFPDADPPVQLEGEIVMQPFSTAVVLPETGAATPWTWIAIVIGGIVALAAGILISRLRDIRGARVDK